MNQVPTIASDTAVLSRFTARHSGAFWLAKTLMLIAGCFAGQVSGYARAQSSDTIEDHTADIESAKDSLAKIRSAINSGDFSSAQPLMTEQGANEVAIWVTSFSMLLTDPEIGKNYPEEFDSVRDALKPVLADHGLDLELNHLALTPSPRRSRFWTRMASVGRSSANCGRPLKRPRWS